MESRITLKSVVTTKSRKINPPAAIYQLVARRLNPREIVLTCCSPESPSISERLLNSCWLSSRLSSTRPKSWIRMIRIKGNEKLVKKAVAPAIRNGSFLFKRRKAFFGICQFDPSTTLEFVFFVEEQKYIRHHLLQYFMVSPLMVFDQ